MPQIIYGELDIPSEIYFCHHITWWLMGTAKGGGRAHLVHRKSPSYQSDPRTVLITSWGLVSLCRRLPGQKTVRNPTSQQRNQHQKISTETTVHICLKRARNAVSAFCVGEACPWEGETARQGSTLPLKAAPPSAVILKGNTPHRHWEKSWLAQGEALTFQGGCSPFNSPSSLQGDYFSQALARISLTPLQTLSSHVNPK